MLISCSIVQVVIRHSVAVAMLHRSTSAHGGNTATHWQRHHLHFDFSPRSMLSLWRQCGRASRADTLSSRKSWALSAFVWTSKMGYLPAVHACKNIVPECQMRNDLQRTAAAPGKPPDFTQVKLCSLILCSIAQVVIRHSASLAVLHGLTWATYLQWMHFSMGIVPGAQ